jgi:hypothetical protein
MSSSHHRVLVSNRGDGNWVSTNNELNATEDIYFPHGATKNDVPTSTQDFTNDLDFSGWGTKSNWMVQAKIGAAGTNLVVEVYAMRPSGVEELVSTGTTLVVGGPTSVSYGGIAAERIAGPISYFRFKCTAISGLSVVSCSVIGWNEGDIVT